MSASAGCRRQEDLLDAREPAAERRGQRRLHGRGRVGRCQVGRHRLDDRDPCIGGRRQRQQPVVVADERDRTSGQLGGQCLMVAAPDDVERRLVVAVPASCGARSAGPWPPRRPGHRAGRAAAPARGPPPAVRALPRRASRAGRPRRPGGRRSRRRSGPSPGPGRACRGHRVTVTPSNCSCPRSRSRRTAADRLVGRSPSWPGSAKWPVMTIRAPASSAARNGTSSRSASSASVRGTSGSS